MQGHLMYCILSYKGLHNIQLWPSMMLFQLCKCQTLYQHICDVVLKPFTMTIWSATLCADLPLDQRSFARLPKDVLSNIRDRLDLDELIALRRTCKPMIALIDESLIVQHARRMILAYDCPNDSLTSADCDKLLACCGFTDVPKGMDFKAWLHVELIKKHFLEDPLGMGLQAMASNIWKKIWFHTCVVPLWPSKHLFYKYLSQFETQLEENSQSAAEMYAEAETVYEAQYHSGAMQWVRPAYMREYEEREAAKAEHEINVWFKG